MRAAFEGSTPLGLQGMQAVWCDCKSRRLCHNYPTMREGHTAADAGAWHAKQRQRAARREATRDPKGSAACLLPPNLLCVLQACPAISCTWSCCAADLRTHAPLSLQRPGQAPAPGRLREPVHALCGGVSICAVRLVEGVREAQQLCGACACVRACACLHARACVRVRACAPGALGVGPPQGGVAAGASAVVPCMHTSAPTACSAKWCWGSRMHTSTPWCAYACELSVGVCLSVCVCACAPYECVCV